jgi:hypothetical protein
MGPASARPRGSIVGVRDSSATAKRVPLDIGYRFRRLLLCIGCLNPPKQSLSFKEFDFPSRLVPPEFLVPSRLVPSEFYVPSNPLHRPKVSDWVEARRGIVCEPGI